MPQSRWIVLAAIALFLCAAAQAADPPPQSAPAGANGQVIYIWPSLAPGETADGPPVYGTSGAPGSIAEVTRPCLTIYRSDTGTPVVRPCVLVLPGGGYSHLASTKEGSEIAAWLNSLGYVAAVLEYRVPNNRTGAFQDAQRAMSLLRARAAELSINPRRIGVMGFSAGGHLAARLSVGYADRSYPAIDSIDAVSCRPDFTLLIYPAYLTPQGSEPAPEVQPRRGMPPVFLEQALDDHYLDAPAYADALKKQDIPYRIALYDVGGHGYGLHAPSTEPVSQWPAEAAFWMRSKASPPPP